MSIRTTGRWFCVHALMPARRGAGKHRARAQRVCFPTLCLAYLFLAAGAGADRYVATNGSHSLSYLTWATAATNIQSAVAVATNGEAIWVSNGTYYVTNGVGIAISRTNTLKSMNGPAVTIVDGMNTSRHFMIYNVGAVVDGFTLTNGNPNGDAGGNHGGAFRIWVGGTIRNCVFSGNKSASGGAGWLANTNALVQNCVVSGNTAAGSGGAFFVNAGGTIRNCTISHNLASSSGGGISMSAAGSIVEGCLISENTANGIASGNWGGGGGNLSLGAIMRNCLLVSNVCSRYGGGFYASSMYDGMISSCTVVNNHAVEGGGAYIGASYNTNCIANCIVYSNTASTVRVDFDGYDWVSGSVYSYTNAFIYCCGSRAQFLRPNVGNISNYPQFVNAVGDYRLRRGSPCINTGTNQAWMEGAVDFDGHARRDRFSGIVDMGCYEFLPAGTMLISR